ncbi:hypothetical protein R0131_14475 [Clostridium sp. AL.422]|uniref:hypothetical protein n=1 Tax=Clostridium TaxID=1485 RepID=UPI00293DCCCC|nr:MULTISPECIES: hypothetical protein [unclassified Clostridium]MDV4152031.1 hypothetical protein [Clostridium sp. AL.422]
MYGYNWIFQADSIGEFFKRLGITLVSIVLLLMYFIGVTFFVGGYIKGVNSNYIFIATKTLDNIICIVVPLIVILMILSKIKVKYKFRIYSINKSFNVIYYLILISLIITFVNSLNNYTVFYKDKIVKNNIIKYFEKEYYYSDIESSDIGINWRGKKYPSFYYKVKFNDEYKLNLANGIIFGDYDIDKLVEVNDILIENKITRNIDRIYLDVYIIDRNDNIKLSMEKLFSK